MKREHRVFHHLFWYVAGPVLILLLIGNLPDSDRTSEPIAVLPPHSIVSVLP